MLSLIRETVFGRLIRILTGRRVLQYEEEYDPATCAASLAETKKRDDAPSGRTLKTRGSLGDDGCDKGDAIEAAMASTTEDSLHDKDAEQVLVDWYGGDDQGNHRRRRSLVMRS